MRSIKMVDLHGQYLRAKTEIDQAIQESVDRADFIQGKSVNDFEQSLSSYLKGPRIISCGNGTDALQIAMMSLDFKPGDEIILPVYTYVSTAEVIALLNLVPVFVDVDENTFTIDVTKVAKLITKKTVAIVPVHLYGQCSDMSSLLDLANKNNIYVIEDAAQSLGADHIFPDGTRKASGSIGVIGTTSFFPTKNLGAFGDGGALMTNDPALAERVRMIVNHGQKKKYYHDIVGVNSRLDTVQASILNVKLKYLESYNRKRNEVADYYDSQLSSTKFLKIPFRASYSTHVFHQYTIVVHNGLRDELKSFLLDRDIPTMIYYPEPLHLQKAYQKENVGAGAFPVSEKLSKSVLSLPIHTEMDTDQLSYICDAIKGFR